MKFVLKQNGEYIRIEANKLSIQCQRGYVYTDQSGEQVYVLDEPVDEIIIKGVKS